MNNKNVYKVTFWYQKFNNELGEASIEVKGTEESYKRVKVDDKKLAMAIEQKAKLKKAIIIEIS